MGVSPKALKLSEEGNVGKGKMKEKTGLAGKTTDQFLYMFTDLYSKLLN